jgi:hypothetical protein
MAAEDVAKVLVALADDDVRKAVASGDLKPLGKLRLSKEEASMVREAAQDLSKGAKRFDKDSPVIRAAVYAAQGPIADEIKPKLDVFLRDRFGGDLGTFEHHNWAYA